MSTLLTETPTPMPTVPASIALPVAFALASVSASVASVTLPAVAVTLEPSANDAWEIVVTMLIATAPATVTVFLSLPELLESWSDVSAFAFFVSFVFELVVPLSVAPLVRVLQLVVGLVVDVLARARRRALALGARRARVGLGLVVRRAERGEANGRALDRARDGRVDLVVRDREREREADHDLAAGRVGLGGRRRLRRLRRGDGRRAGRGQRLRCAAGDRGGRDDRRQRDRGVGGERERRADAACGPASA